MATRLKLARDALYAKVQAQFTASTEATQRNGDVPVEFPGTITTIVNFADGTDRTQYQTSGTAEHTLPVRITGYGKVNAPSEIAGVVDALRTKIVAAVNDDHTLAGLAWDVTPDGDEAENDRTDEEEHGTVAVYRLPVVIKLITDATDWSVAA